MKRTKNNVFNLSIQGWCWEMLFKITKMFEYRFFTFCNKDPLPRFDEKGRMLAERVRYIDGRINEQITACYQLMKAFQKKN